MKTKSKSDSWFDLTLTRRNDRIAHFYFQACADQLMLF